MSVLPGQCGFYSGYFLGEVGHMLFLSIFSLTGRARDGVEAHSSPLSPGRPRPQIYPCRDNHPGGEGSRALVEPSDGPAVFKSRNDSHWSIQGHRHSHGATLGPVFRALASLRILRRAQAGGGRSGIRIPDRVCVGGSGRRWRWGAGRDGMGILMPEINNDRINRGYNEKNNGVRC